jgi:hypothetical protein
MAMAEEQFGGIGTDLDRQMPVMRASLADISFRIAGQCRIS